jgi:hypothetical protein
MKGVSAPAPLIFSKKRSAGYTPLAVPVICYFCARN